MYERSAIVLERYFDNLLDYSQTYNLRYNFRNYCELVEKLEKYQTNYQKEMLALKEYNEVLDNIKQIQLSEKEMYKISAKLEYDRNLLFKNIDGKVEDTRKCIEKIEEDVAKNNEDMKELKEKLLLAIESYNEKKFELSKAKRYKKISENEYNDSYDKAKATFENIPSETMSKFKSFVRFQDEDSVVLELEDNGKNEKIPFNEDVMQKATKFFIVVAKNEADCYTVIYEKMEKLLADIENGTARINLHKKYVRNEKAKVDFLFAVKNYIVQFLDYERMTVIHGRKSHNRLMQEACENFSNDSEQINNLYDLLLKEIANKATKKSYKDLYNKSYLIDIKEKEERFKREKNRINLDTATMINTNYWRIEGIREIYSTFYKNVSEVFGRDVAEFDIPKDIDPDQDSDDANDSDYDGIVRIPFELDLDDDEDVNVAPKNIKSEKQTSSKINQNVEDILIDDNEFKDLDAEDDEESDDSEDSDELDVSELLTSSKMKPKRKRLIFEDISDESENDEDEEEDDDDDTEESSYNAFKEKNEYSLDDEENIKEIDSKEDDFDIFGSKYKNTDFIEENIIQAAKSKNSNIFKNLNVDINDVDDNIDSHEENLFTSNQEDEEDDVYEKPKKKNVGIFGKIKRGRKKNSALDEDIW